MNAAAANLLVAASIRAEMARAGVPQMRVAQELGLSQTAVSRRLRGVTPWFLWEVLAIANLLGVAPSVLVETNTDLRATA